MTNLKKVIIHSITHFTIYNFRLPLIKDLQSRGIEVIALGKVDDYTKLLEQENVRCIDSKISIDGINLIEEFKFIKYLNTISKQENADLIHHFSPKPVLFGSIAFGLNRKTKNIATVTGLGHAYNINRFHPVRIITDILYLISNQFIDKYIFLNTDDMRELFSSGLVSKGKSSFICGEGVDLIKYNYKNCNNYIKNDKVIFTFMARLLYEKGIQEFIEAAKIISDKNKNCEFWIIGDIYENPSCMSMETLKLLIKNYSNIIYHGQVFNIEELMCKTSVFVLPTYYKEGLPRSIIEAMAYKKPIITTNSSGARHTVIDGYNGFLIEKRNVNSLVEAIEKILNLNDESLLKMGQNSYQRVKVLFDVSKINKKNFRLYSKFFSENIFNENV